MGTRDDDFSNTSVRPSSASSRFSSYLSLDLQSGQMSNASQYLDSMVSPGPHSFSDASTYSMSFAASEAGGPFSMHYNAGEQQEPKSESKSSSKLLESEDSIRKPSPGIGSLPYLQLFRYADWVDWVLMVLGSVGAVLHGLVIPLGIYVISKIMTALGTNELHSAQFYKEVLKGVLVMIYIAVQIPWLGFMEVGFWTITGDRQTGRIRAKYLRAMLRQEVGYYDTEMTTGEILHLISVDSMLLQDAMGERVSSFLHNVSTFIGGLAFMLIEVWQLALICVFLLPVTFTIAVTYTKIYTKFAVQAAGAYKTTDSLIEQTVSQIRTVYSYVGETKAGQALSQLLEMAVRLSRSGGLAKGFGLGITLALNNMQWAIMFWVGAVLIADGQNIPPANIMACALTAVFTGPSLGVALRETETFAKGKVAAYRIFEIIERQPRIDSLSLAGDVLPSLKGEIELSNVHFAYPARPDVTLFKNLSLRIPAGKTVALVGASGSGKSTVISLIERFYDPSSGVVKLDGVDIKTLQLKWLRSQTGLVGQEPVLFAASIKENILHGKEGATDQDVISASQAANAHSFISGLPLQYETQVGERGLQLSGGQKQRVAIARAVLKNPSILLLDEATSALDTESEQVVQQALNNLMQGRTTVVVAHRLSTIQHADLIAVFDRGQIAELGTHSELLSKGSSGIYYTLVNLQASSAQSYRATGSAAPSPARWSNVQASPLSSSYHASPAGTVLHRRSFHGGSESRRRSFHAGIEVGTWSGIYSPHSEMFSASMDRPKFLASPALSEMLSPNLGPQYSAFSPLPARQPVQPQPTCTYLEEMDDNKATQEPTLKKFPVGTAIQFLKGKAILSVVALVASCVAGWFNPLFAVLSVRMLGLFFEPNITGPHLKSGVAKYCIVFVGLGFINLISTATQQIYSTTIGATVSKRMEEAAFKALLQNEVAWFDREENNSAAVTSRLSTDSAIVKIALTERVSCLVQYGTSLILAVVLAIAISWRMAIVALSAFPLALFSGAMRNSFLTGALGGNSKLSQERSAQIAAEAVGNIRTVASLCLEEKLLSVFENQVKSGNKSRSRKSLLGGLMFGIAHCLTLIASGCCLLYGAYLISKGQATFVTIVSVFQVVGHTAFHLLESLKIFPDLRKAKEAALSTFDIISRKSSIDPDSGKGGADDSGSAIAGTIELQNVFFSYPSRPDTPILQGMHLLIPGNSTTALVGPSGSGKSSVVALIERFYDPDRGRVLLDGKDITGLNLRRLRQHIALVQQEPALFSTTIRDNILYGRQGATEAEVVEAAKGANAHSFISGLPEGYDTEVGERGTQLSGGQKQRIAIARAILKNPKVLLLDEATSALDAESERVVQEALDRLMQGARTTLVIAHRLSTIQNAPQIAVVSQGQVVEKGTHAKLLRAKGVYAQLVQLQQLKS